jgi:ribose 5-phosphate isomerase B
MRIATGSDHAGFELKNQLKEHLKELGHIAVDKGAHVFNREDDYPDFGKAVGQSVALGEADLGLCVCGTGIGISIAANKIKGIRAAVVHDVSSAKLARAHNNANVVCFGSRLIGIQTARDALEAFLSTSFEEGRHERRIEKIAQIEKRQNIDG